MPSSKKRLTLGYPLDLLFNRDCLLSEYEKSTLKGMISFPELKFFNKGKRGGVVLPSKDHPGTGNIIIRGRPGTGKSTLALQMAVACQNIPNNYLSAYFSLEERAENVLMKAKMFGWENAVRSIRHLHSLSEFSTPKEYGKILLDILGQCDTECPMYCEEDNCLEKCTDKSKHKDFSLSNLKTVLLPALSPRSLDVKVEESNKLFWERYHELERLLMGAKWIRENDDYQESVPELRMVVVDSLNVFGDQLLSREELYRLFDLFKRYQVIGVFIVEEDERQTFSPDSRLHGDIIEYLADMVISLSSMNNGYFVRYFEIVKARYQHQVYGKHPFRLSQKIEPNGDKQPEHFLHTGVVILPSLHYIVFGTEKFSHPEQLPQNRFPSEYLKSATENPFNFGIKNVERLFPINSPYKRVGIIIGSRGTLKTILAQNFLMSGFVRGENVLLIRLKDRSNFDPIDAFTYNSDVKKEILEKISYRGKNPEKRFEEFRKEFYPKSNPVDNSKISIFKWMNSLIPGNRFIEINFKSGNILVEEFIEIIRQQILQEKAGSHPITRVVLDDISLIGISYPFLSESPTAGNLFITAFIHIMRNYSINMVMVGTSNQLEPADNAVKRAEALSDVIITTDTCDVFGDRLVIVSGDGLKVTNPHFENDDIIDRKYGEYVPGVINSIRKQEFSLDMERLEGLVGFESKNIRRPGIKLHLFEAGKILKKYHKGIKSILQCAFPSQSRKGNKNYIEEQLDIIPFNEDLSESIHDSLTVLGGAPVDSTVISAVDEFFIAYDNFLPLNFKKEEYPEVTGEQITRNLRPYYGNVLLKAKRNVESEELKLRTSELAKKDKIDQSNRECGDISKWYQVKGDKANKGNMEVMPLNSFMIENKKEGKGETSSDCMECSLPILFDFDAKSNETLACLLLDALFSIDEESGSPMIKMRAIRKEFNELKPKLEQVEGKKLKEEVKKNKIYSTLINFYTMLTYSAPYHCKKKKVDFCPKAEVYLCWYSQLREIIESHPDFAKEMRVESLPGNGFTGDWRIGIMKGSVSINLGQKIINMLCDEKEEYKRFARGVGLPVRKKFFKETGNEDEVDPKFFAWPGSLKSDLNAIYNIHKEATPRSKISGYTKLRAPLAKICRQLVEIKDLTFEEVLKIVERIPEQIELFAPEAFEENN